MARRRKRQQIDSPEERFRVKLLEEYRRTPGMTVKIERMPQGRMHGHVVKCLPACRLDVYDLEGHLSGWFGNGLYLLTFVDEEGEPLEEFGHRWLSLAYPDAADMEDGSGMDMQRAQTELLRSQRQLTKEQSLLLLGSQELQKESHKKLAMRLVDVCSRLRESQRREESMDSLMLALVEMAQGHEGVDLKELLKFQQEAQNEQRKARQQRTARQTAVACEAVLGTLGAQRYGQPEGRQSELQMQASQLGDTTQQEAEQRLQTSESQVHPPFISGQLACQVRPGYRLLGIENGISSEDASEPMEGDRTGDKDGDDDRPGHES